MIKIKLLILLFMLNFATNIEASSKAETLQIRALSEAYELSVPVSRLIMAIPSVGLLQGENSGGAADSPRYFMFADKTQNLIISGWFEPEQAFSGIQAFWKSETASWKRRGLPKPQYVSFVKIGNWDSIIYDIPTPSGSNSHIRAHWLQAGTWIDIHLSITTDKKSEVNRVKLNSILTKIQIKVQSDG